MRTKLFLSAVVGAVTLAVGAHAADFTFSFTAKNGTQVGSGILTTGQANPAGSFFTPSLLITGISGTFANSAISALLAPGTFYQTSGTFGSPGNDNILYYPSTQTFNNQPTYLDRNGVSFTTGKGTYNLFFGLGGYGELKQNADGSATSSNIGGTFTVGPAAVSAAPEPGVWALMFGGIAMMGAMMRFGRRRSGGAVVA